MGTPCGGGGEGPGSPSSPTTPDRLPGNRGAVGATPSPAFGHFPGDGDRPRLDRAVERQGRAVRSWRLALLRCHWGRD